MDPNSIMVTRFRPTSSAHAMSDGVAFARCRLSRVRYEELDELVRLRYPIDEIWDASTRRLRDRPFRISRVHDHMVAIFDGDVRFRVVDVRCACVFYMMLREDLDDPERVRHKAHARTAVATRASHEPRATIALRHAAAAHRRCALGVRDLVHARTPVVEDGAEWRACLEAMDASPVALNPCVSDLRTTIRRART